MIIANKFNGYTRDGRREYHFGGGSSGPTSSTVTQSNVPDWLQPQVEGLLGGAGQQLFNTTPQAPTYDASGTQTNTGQYDITGVKPFTPYSANPTDYTAGFSPLQQQVQANVANLQMPDQFNQSTGLSTAAGMGGLGTAQQAAGAGQNYANQVTNPGDVSQYMNPYMQNVVNTQNTEAQRQADIASQNRGAAASRAGAFGGARQAIENSEAQRNLSTLMNTNQATGSQNAYNSAIQNMQFGSNLGLQGLANAQSGYGLANQAAGTLGSTGTQQLGAQSGILGLQSQVGAQQQQDQQAAINNAINNYSQAQQYPMQQMNAYNALLRGYAVPGQTTTSYQAAPSGVSQLAGLGTAALGASQLMKVAAAGGLPKDFKNSKRQGSGIDTLAMYQAMKG